MTLRPIPAHAAVADLAPPIAPLTEADRREAARLAFEATLAAPYGDRPDRDDGTPMYPATPRVRAPRHREALCQPEGADCQPAIIATPWRPVYAPERSSAHLPTVEESIARIRAALARPRRLLGYAPRPGDVVPTVSDVEADRPVAAPGAWVAEIRRRGR